METLIGVGINNLMGKFPTQPKDKSLIWVKEWNFGKCQLKGLKKP